MRYANVNSETADTLIADLGDHASTLLALAARQICIVGRQDQDPAPFSMKAVRALPWVAIVRDDPFPCGRARGPDGFHGESLVALLRAAFAVSLIVCELDQGNYHASAALGLTGRSSVIIETDLEQESAWIAFIVTNAPGKLFTFGLAEITGRA